MKVVNLRTDPYEVYIGRAGKGKDGYFGNPIVLSQGGDRAAVLVKFKEYFDARIKSDVEYAQRVLSLRGEVCGCFCKPLACHGDVMAAWIARASCECCGASAPIAVDREPHAVVLLCGECAK